MLAVLCRKFIQGRSIRSLLYDVLHLFDFRSGSEP